MKPSQQDSIRFSGGREKDENVFSLFLSRWFAARCDRKSLEWGEGYIALGKIAEETSPPRKTRVWANAT